MAIHFLTVLKQEVLQDIKNAEGCLFGCKNLLNFTCLIIKFHKCHHINVGGENCAVVAGDGKWADLRCDHPTRWAVCEIDKPGRFLSP